MQAFWIGDELKENSMALVDFTGKETESGRIFDTTNEKTAKEAGIYRENAVFKPVPVIVGKKEVLEGIDDALKEMNEGETKTVKMKPSKAFGERRKELIVIVPLQEFLNRRIQPMPGLIVDLNGNYGRVQTVSGGRVRVDLNNDLAGKEVEYEIKVIKEVKNLKEKAELLTEKFFPFKKKVETKIENGVLKLVFPEEVKKHAAELLVPFTDYLKGAVPEIKSVEAADEPTGGSEESKEKK